MPPPPLPLTPQQSRINLSDLKSQIVKRLGPERAQQYFHHLNRLLSQKLSKAEFNKLCISTLGRENVALHNQLIWSILRNACHAKVPPPAVHEKSIKKVVNDGEPNQCVASLSPVWSNGSILPSSPRKSRSGIRRIKDRPSPLGPTGTVEVTAHQSLPVPSDEVVSRENGESTLCDLKRPVQHHQSAEQPAKRLWTGKTSLQYQVSSDNKSLFELAAVEDREDVERRDDLKYIRGPPQAPLGIPFCPASVGGARRLLPSNFSSGTFNSTTSYHSDSGELCSTEDLRMWMEKIAQGQGLGGVTVECAGILNRGLDAYLKRLIRSSAELVRARVRQEPLKQMVYKQQSNGKLINGICPGNHMYVQSSAGPSDGTQEQKNHCLISLHDFNVAMELSPHQLGEDWPLLLEKICLNSFDK